MKIYATYNIKGGVGKTSAAVNLAHLAARSGYNVLLWDLDPQGAATYLFRVRPKVKGGSRALVEGTRTLDDAIKATDFDGLDLLPADFSYRNMDRAAGRREAADASDSPAVATAGRAIRRGLPRLPPEHFVAVGERPACRRHAAGADDPGDVIGSHVRPIGKLRQRFRRPPTAGARVLLDGGPAQAIASRPRGAVVGRKSGNPDHGDSGAVDHRADGRTTGTGDGVRAAQRRVTVLQSVVG